jgi:hypothetical protein
MRLFSLAIAFLGLAPVAVDAQVRSPLVTDRPDFTESPLSVDPGRVQLEAGYTFSRASEVTLHSFGEVLVRVGTLSRLELRLGLNSFGLSDAEATESGFEDVVLGAKVELAEGLALLFGAAFPTGSGAFGERGVRPQATLAMGWSLSPALSLGANLGGASARVGDERYGLLSGSLAVGLGLTERAGLYAEVFGFAAPSASEANIAFLNGGVTVLITDDLQLDARVGVSLDDPGPNYFFGAGFGWRI